MFRTLAVGGWALLGHFALGIMLINRVHGLGIPHRVQRRWDVVWCVWQAMVPLAMLYYGAQSTAWTSSTSKFAVWGYFAVGQLALIWGLIGWAERRFATHTRHLLVDQAERHPLTTWPDRCELACDFGTRLLARIPGNQIFELHVHEKRLYIPHLPLAWEGLRIAHLSDLHYTGQISADFFARVVAHTNAGRPDLIAITGDIVDKTPCIPWIKPTLGALEAPHGVWFILGNHDARVVRVPELRQALQQAGLQDLGGKSLEIRRNSIPLRLVGNELPWFGPAGTLQPVAPSSSGASPHCFTIALAHSPDQIDWAVRNGIDLLLAGHTHGGQVRFPVIGPIFSPSRYGVRYASGTFHRDPTVMHVSRGLSGTRPLRIRCAPELAFLTLTARGASS